MNHVARFGRGFIPHRFVCVLRMAATLGALAAGSPGHASVLSCTTGSTPQNFVYAGAIQQCLVSSSGVYDLTASGGRGGSSTNGNAGGAAAMLELQIHLSAGTLLDILVGGAGGAGGPFYATSSGGGGGGTFVVFDNGGAPLLIAGGGGGAGSTAAGNDASLGTSGATGLYGSGAGGTAGHGGTGGDAGSGGGLLTAGDNKYHDALSGNAFVQGGQGKPGTYPSGYGALGGGAAGFTGSTYAAGGGGGGYGGGGGGGSALLFIGGNAQFGGGGGGGGGSYGDLDGSLIASSVQSASLVIDGLFTISQLSVDAAAGVVPEPQLPLLLGIGAVVAIARRRREARDVPSIA